MAIARPPLTVAVPTPTHSQRLSGLDGEATEPVIKQLPAAVDEGESPEERFAAAAVLSERSGAGLRLLLALLAARAPGPRRAAPQLLKLLAAACAVRACRRGLLQVGALHALLHLVHAACRPLLESDTGASGAGPAEVASTPLSRRGSSVAGAAAEPVPAPAPAVPPGQAVGAPEATVQLGGGWAQAQLFETLKALESLANEANALQGAPVAGAPAAQGRGAGAAAAEVASEADVAVDVCQLGRGLTLLERHGLGDCGAVLARVLTALARSDAAAQRGLLDHFAPALDLEAFDAASAYGGAGGRADEQRLQLQGLLKLTEALTAGASEGGAGSARGAAEEGPADCGFRQLVLARGIPGQLARYLVGCFAEPSCAGRDAASPGPSDGGAAEPPGLAIPGKRQGEEDEEGEEGHHDDWMFGVSPAAAAAAVSPETPRLLQPRGAPSPSPTPTPPRASARRMPALSPAAASGGGPRLVDPASSAWRTAVARPGVAAALQLLTALARGHGGVSRVLADAPGLLGLAHALEGVHGGRDLAPLAEGLLEAASAAAGREVRERVGAMRSTTRAAMRAMAARKREEMLAAMGMVQVGVAPCKGQRNRVALKGHLPCVAIVSAVHAECISRGWGGSAMHGDRMGFGEARMHVPVDGAEPHVTNLAHLEASPPPSRHPSLAAARPRRCRPQLSGEGAPGSAGTPRIAPSPASVPALSPLAAELAVLDEEGEDEPEGLCCMVCREGYALQPGALLGAYAFTRAVPADELPGCAPPPGASGNAPAGGWPGPSAGAGAAGGSMLTTVSHFNLIHAACHASARAADAALRQPKREWEGASRRNGDVLCNCLVPLRGGAVGETTYVAAVAAMWEAQTAAPLSGGGAAAAAARRMCAALRAADGTGARLSLLAADVAALLRRFAWRLSFSDEARGGGRGSNCRLLLGLLQLGRYYSEQLHAGERRTLAELLTSAEDAGRAALAAAGSSSGAGSGGAVPAAGGRGSVAPEAHAPHTLALALVLSSPEEWTRARGPMLALAARHSVRLALEDRGDLEAGGASGFGGDGPQAMEAAAAQLSGQELFEAAAPGLRLFGLADALQAWAKPARGVGGWGRAMAQRLADLRACEQGAKQLLAQLEEAEDAGDAQEVLDVVGALGLALGAALRGGGAGGACASADEWLRRVVCASDGSVAAGAAAAAPAPAGDS
jgi:hypothetical protein